jgi:hypothetical protein
MTKWDGIGVCGDSFVNFLLFWHCLSVQFFLLLTSRNLMRVYLLGMKKKSIPQAIFEINSNVQVTNSGFRLPKFSRTTLKHPKFPVVKISWSQLSNSISQRLECHDQWLDSFRKIQTLSSPMLEELKVILSAHKERAMRLSKIASGMTTLKGDLRSKTTFVFPPIDNFTRNPNLSELRIGNCSFGCLRRRCRTLTRRDAIARGKTPRMRHSFKRFEHVVWFEKALYKGCQLTKIFAITWWMKALNVSDSCRGSPNHGSLVLLSVRNKSMNCSLTTYASFFSIIVLVTVVFGQSWPFPSMSQIWIIILKWLRSNRNIIMAPIHDEMVKGMAYL